MSAERPLITFAILAYNQEQYISEAIDAAFAQTYEPLQIILSDDCSPDRTFEIMQEMAAAYLGPHRVCLNRNPTNRHIGGHINRVMELAEGDLIVIAAGDDISAAERVARNFEAWDAAGRPEYCSIFSSVEEFNETGRLGVSKAGEPLPIPTGFLFDDYRSINGSSHAYTTATFRYFGDMSEGVVNEDGAIHFRNRLMGKMLYLDEVLVRHRMHLQSTGLSGWGDLSTAGKVDAAYRTFLSRRRALVNCMSNDLHTFQTKRQAEPGFRKPYTTSCVQKLYGREMRLCSSGLSALESGVVRRAIFVLRCFTQDSNTGAFCRSCWWRIVFTKLYASAKGFVSRGPRRNDA